MKPAPPAAKELIQRLRRIMRQVARIEQAPMVLGEVVLSPTALDLLTAVKREPGKQMSELASELGVTKGAVTQMTDRLVSLGLVERRPSKSDRRSFVLTVLSDGEAALKLHDAYHAKADAVLLAGMKAYPSRFLGELWKFLDLVELQVSVYEQDVERLAPGAERKGDRKANRPD